MKPVFFLKDWRRNRNFGMSSFLVQRLTGLALVVYLVLHLVTLGGITGGPAGFDRSLGKFENPAGHALEYLLLLCVAAHLLNGLRIVCVDAFSLTGRHKWLLAWAVAAGLVVAGVSIFWFIPEIR